MNENEKPQLPAPVPTLYHYCSASGLHRTFNERFLSATHVGFFNDTMEIMHAVDLLGKVVADRLSGQADLSATLFLKRLLQQASKITSFDIFVFCLSENGDLLSQWRGYCPGEGGYSIGFNFDDLWALAGASNFFLRPCFYRIDEQLDLVGDLVDKALQKFNKGEIPASAALDNSIKDKKPPTHQNEWASELIELLTTSIDEQRNELVILAVELMAIEHGVMDPNLLPRDLAYRVMQAMGKAIPEGGSPIEIDDVVNAGIAKALWIRNLIADFIAAFILVAPTLKHPSFSEEKEWRLISFPKKLSSPGVAFRPTASSLVPYFKLHHTTDTSKIALDRIYVGPTSNPQRSKFALEGFLVSKGVQYGEVLLSEIPFRNW